MKPDKRCDTWIDPVRPGPDGLLTGATIYVGCSNSTEITLKYGSRSIHISTRNSIDDKI